MIHFRFFLGSVRSGLFWNGNTFILKILPWKRILWRTEQSAPLPLLSIQSRSVTGISNRGTSLLGGDEEGKDYHFFSFKVDKSWDGSVNVKCLNWYWRQFYLGTGLIVIGLKGLKNIKGRRHSISWFITFRVFKTQNLKISNLWSNLCNTQRSTGFWGISSKSGEFSIN